MFRASVGRPLLAAKTSVKEPVKAAKAKAAKVVKEKKQIDLSKFQHCKWKGTNLLQLVNALPKPAKPDIADNSTWLHKNGYGLKFYRQPWARYPEPCYWTVAKFKPRVGTVWGFLTWRGVTEPVPRTIPSLFKREWRILVEPGTQLGPSVDDCWTAPEITAESLPQNSTQLPEGLKGTKDGSWPYPWGAQGLMPRLGPSGPRSILINKPEDAEAETKEEAQ